MNDQRWPATDPLEREPKKVWTLVTIDPRGDIRYLINARQAFDVEWFEPDRRGVGVRSDAGCYVSLHPSEFEVLEWAEEPAKSEYLAAGRSGSREGVG